MYKNVPCLSMKIHPTHKMIIFSEALEHFSMMLFPVLLGFENDCYVMTASLVI